MQRHDPTLLKYAGEIRDSDTLWNVCCYEYLLNIANKITPEIARRYAFLRELHENIIKPGGYESQVSYGHLYSKLIENLEHLFRSLRLENTQYKPGELDELLDIIYKNENHALERVGRILEEISSIHSQTSADFLKAIHERLPQTEKVFLSPINKQNPVEEGSLLNLGIRMVSGTFKPMQITSMPAIRTYRYKENGTYPLEIRMGTQAQRHEDHPEINPIFREWLECQVNLGNESANASGITHLYINNLPRDRTDFAGTKERMLTEQLEKLESSQHNIAVVTLPADKGLLRHANLESKEKKISARNAFAQMLAIAIGDSKDAIQDFYISPRVKKLLYGTVNDEYDVQTEKMDMTQLLDKSFIKLSLDKDGLLSKAEIAAVYFHFIKYELTNYLIERLEPVSFNTSCKDGIDRGGASSAYYNLMRSITDGKPMSESEFHTALHAGPVLVKGRPMNEHVELVWAAIHCALPWLNETYGEKLPRWLHDWEQRNTPEYASTHKHNKDWHVQRLMDYIVKRSDESKHRTFIGEASNKSDREQKIATAKKLINIMNQLDEKLDDADKKALSEGRLHDIFQDMIADGYLNPQDRARPGPGMHDNT